MLSIIVPAFNAEKYIDECVSSLISQTYSNLEIIIVDDGSTDRTLKKCKEWAKKDSRIRIISKKNGGQGSARNEGFKISKGNYIGFVDSDDVISQNMYQTLIEIMVNNDCDIGVCESVHFLNTPSIKQNEIIQRMVLPSFDALEERLKQGKIITDSPCNKLFSRSIIEKCPFLENRFLEDSAFLYKAIANSNKIIATNECSYFVRDNSLSESRKHYNIKRCDTILTYEEMLDFVKNDCRFVSLIPDVEKHLCGAVFYNAGEFGRLNTKDKAGLNKIKEFAKRVKKECQHLTIKQSFLLFLIVHLFKIYKLLYRAEK